MKSTAFVTAVAVAAAIFSVAANAQTGRPSAVEVKAAADTPHAVAADEALGSYARYLMLNGATREQAIAQARNIDHAPTRTLLASRAPARTDAPAHP
ncbi:MAG TPA: hypothetical protein VIP05_24910 [Burkholderiaceae bacterium]